MRKQVVWDEEACIGCRLCEIYCIMAHSRYPDNVLKAFKRQKDRPVARVFVEAKDSTSYALMCRHCLEPECVKSCLTGALRRDTETGVVKIDEAHCVGCWTCVISCPYGAIRPSVGDRRIAAKCDLCLGKTEIPACVARCPNEALELKKCEEVEECEREG